MAKREAKRVKRATQWYQYLDEADRRYTHPKKLAWLQACAPPSVVAQQFDFRIIIPKLKPSVFKVATPQTLCICTEYIGSRQFNDGSYVYIEHIKSLDLVRARYGDVDVTEAVRALAMQQEIYKETRKERLRRIAGRDHICAECNRREDCVESEGRWVCFRCS
jgi:hypothetical protein